MFSSRVEDETGIELQRRVRFYPDARRRQPSFVEFKAKGEAKAVNEEQVPWWKRTLDPRSEAMLRWNWIFLVMCLVALFVDPLYFYLPFIEKGSEGAACLAKDRRLSVVITVFRCIADVFYVIHIFVKFRTAYVAPRSRIFGRGELERDTKLIARRYLRSDFAIDVIAALPLPQMVIWVIIPRLKDSTANGDHNALALIVLLQYLPRLYLIFPLSYQIINATGVVTKTAWAGAAYNLLLYMLASHVLGASWYLLSVDRQTTCWESECAKDSINRARCIPEFLHCKRPNENRTLWAQNTTVFANCNADKDDISFDFGIFKNALTSGAVSTAFMKKYLYCLWWGLQNLSTYGQNLQTSTFVGETLFAILIAIVGLVLFAQLIGNMQRYLQSITVRLEEWRLKRRDTEEWMRHRQLPHDLRKRVRQFVQYDWLATRGVNEESILQCLPTDLRREIKRHLCLDLVRRVPFFAQMDVQLLDAICEHLVSSLSTEDTYIVKEGDPVSEMLFIIRGKLQSSTTNGGRTGFLDSIVLGQGDFCGEELLTWALDPKSSISLPQSTRTVRALVEVEGFALRAEHLKLVANQFRRLHSKKLQHTFRVYSHSWRTWAACFIQAAWRRFKKRKLAQELSQREESAYDGGDRDDDAGYSGMAGVGGVDSADGASSSTVNQLGPRRGSFRVNTMDLPMLQKPEEPDFSLDAYH